MRASSPTFLALLLCVCRLPAAEQPQAIPLWPAGAPEVAGTAEAQQALAQRVTLHKGHTHAVPTWLRAQAADNAATVQMRLAALAQAQAENQAAQALIPYAQAQDIGTIAMKPLAGGNLRLRTPCCP